MQQIQNAVQAGYINPQILDQPLAPHTLQLLSQLVQELSILETLKKAETQNIMGNNGEFIAISLKITKTKENISNLKNRISTQQAAHLKSQNMGSQFSEIGRPSGPVNSGAWNSSSKG